jgi:ribosome-interacting GTPase 1
MPTNLPAEAQAALAKYQEAKTIEEKIRALEEALPLIPDHKGTEKMRAQLKTTLAKLRRELERKKTVKASRHDMFAVKKEGAATVVLLGVSNSGKSSILKALTNANPEIESYELTTKRPVPAMMFVKDVGIQLVELPAILTSELEETPFTTRSLAVARNADLIALTLDGSKNIVQQFEKLLSLLDEAGIQLREKKSEIVVEKKDSGGIRLLVHGRLQASFEDVKQALQQAGIRNAVVKIHGEAGLEDIIDTVMRQVVHKKAIIVVGRADLARMSEVEDLRQRLTTLGIEVLQVSTAQPDTLREFVEKTYDQLGLIRVYTQKDGVVSRRPIVVSHGTTVGELAQLIHKEIARELKFARVWGRSVKIQGQRVGPAHVLEDADVVELYG